MLRYHNITKDDMLNGSGLRVVLWLAGCSHACKGCHNPITWDENGGLEFDSAAETELFAELEKDYISGVTLSGGDPLFLPRRNEVGQLIKKIKDAFPQKNIWLYTGYEWKDIKKLDFMPLVDVVIDGKFVEELADVNYPWAGSTNQKVIDVKKTLAQNEIIYYNGGYNDNKC